MRPNDDDRLAGPAFDGIIAVDRYGGARPPDPDVICQGQCEGTGFYPCRIVEDEDTPAEYRNSPIERERIAAVLREGKQDTSDGYAFIRCPDCEGTGKRAA